MSTRPVQREPPAAARRPAAVRCDPLTYPLVPNARSASRLNARTSRTPLLALPAALALMLSGCSLVTVAVTPHFIAKASAICRRTNLEIESLPVPNATPTSEASIARADARDDAKEIKRLAELTPRRNLRHTYAVALGAAEELFTLDRLEAGDYAHNLPTRAEALVNRSDSLILIADTAMTKLGLPACADDPQPSAAA